MIMPDIFDTDEKREEALTYITEELTFAEQERAKKLPKWDKWRRQREGFPEHTQKDYPFPKAANVAVPLSVSNHNTLYGAAMNMFSDVDPFWHIEAMRDRDTEDLAIAEVLTRYFDLLAKSPSDLDKASVDPVINYESNSMGVMFVKVPYTKLSYTSRRLDPQSGTPTDITITQHDGPEIVPLAMEDMWYREAYRNLQTAPWVAHRLHHTWPEIQQLAEQGVYDKEAVDGLEEWYRTEPETNERSADARAEATQLPSEMWDIFEVYMFWNFDGMFRDCIFTLHRESKTVLREDYNPLGKRPFEPFIYLLKPFRLEGQGVGQLSEYMQDEADSTHNYRLDAMHTAIAPMLALKKTSGIRSGEKVYPSKIWFLDDPQKDWAQMAFPTPQVRIAVESEQIAIMYSQKACGANDAMGGFPDAVVKTRDSPGLQNQRLKQGTGVFSAIMATRKASYARVGELIYYQLILNKEMVIAKEASIKRLSTDDLASLEKALSIDISEVPARLRFSVRTSDVEQTFEGERQNLLTRTQLYAMFFERTFPLAQQIFGPMGQQMMQAAPKLYEYLTRIYIGNCKLMEDTFRFFAEKNTQKYIPDYKRNELVLQLMQAMQGMVGGMNGIQGIPGAGGGPGAGAPGAGALAGAGGAGAVPPGQAPGAGASPFGGLPGGAGGMGGAGGGLPPQA
jgi:hypothetical protein